MFLALASLTGSSKNPSGRPGIGSILASVLATGIGATVAGACIVCLIVT